MIPFRCYCCRRELDVEDDLVGCTLICPDCKARIRVPSSSQFTPSFAIKDAAERPRRSDFTVNESFPFRLLAACLMVMVPLPVAVLLGQPWLCHVTTVSALLLGMVGWVWLLLVAFGNSIWQGLVVLLTPCGWFLPALTNWREAKRPFLLTLAAVFVQVVNVAVQLGLGWA
jgi:hypothetical protein